MAYRITEFEGVKLPQYNTMDDLSTGEVDSALVDALNGSVDYYGSTRKLPRSQKILFRGTYLARKGYIVDEFERALLNEQGDRLLSTSQFFYDLQAKTDVMKSRLGILGQLFRQPEGIYADAAEANQILQDRIDAILKTKTPDNAAIADLRSRMRDPSEQGRQWKLARLLKVKYEKELSDLDKVAHLEMDFQTTMSAWKSESSTVVTAVASGVSEMIVDIGGSETVNDATITITPLSGPLSSIEFSVNNKRIGWYRQTPPGYPSGEDIPVIPTVNPIAAGEDLTIDMGSETVIRGTDDAYANFTTWDNLPGWLYFVPGINRIQIDPTGASVNVIIEYYNQWT